MRMPLNTKKHGKNSSRRKGYKRIFMSDISIIIPVFNAEAILLGSLRRIWQYCDGKGWDYEIILCDDGSADRSSAIMRELASAKRRVRCLYNDCNEGLGVTLRKLVDAASGRVVIYSDLDLPFGEEVFGVLSGGLQNADMIIASRYTTPAPSIPWQRRFCSFLYFLFCRCFFGVRVRDIGSGAVAWRNGLAVLSGTKAKGFGIHIEMLTRATAKGLRIKETAIKPEEFRPGSFSIVRHTVPLMIETFAIWFRMLSSGLN